MSDTRKHVTAGVLKESAPGERRVAMTPGSLRRLSGGGVDVLVESGAGEGANYPDEDYTEAGAAVVSGDEVLERSDAVLAVGAPAESVRGKLRKGQFLLALLQARTSEDLVRGLQDRGVVAVSLDMIPRTVSGAQSMDALTSQANIAGYKAVLVAADAYPRFFPMLMTAAGTMRPAKVLVLGAGVAGLQAIGTANRLGAVVSGYDVRPETRKEVTSLGASFLDIGPSPSGSGAGGYARELSADEQQAQQKALTEQIGAQDVVITTAQVPGRQPPLLVAEEALKAMGPGSVVVDIAASTLGGNVAGSKPDETVVTPNGVTVIGAPNLPSAVAGAASDSYARNIGDLLLHFVRDGQLTVDPSDPIDSAVVVTGSKGQGGSDRSTPPAQGASTGSEVRS